MARSRPRRPGSSPRSRRRGIDESTFIWNPNPIPLFAALAFAGVVMARRTGRARWWLLAGAGAMVTMQLHILGVVILLPLAWAWAADVVARRRSGDATARGPRSVAGSAPSRSSPRATCRSSPTSCATTSRRPARSSSTSPGAAREAAGGALGRIVIVGLRSITWPFAGVITDRIDRVAGGRAHRGGAVRDRGPAPARGRRRPRGIRTRWLLGGFVACVVALALFAPSLATVTPGLPNDHYHNLLDPIVLALAGVGLARLASTVGERARDRGPRRRGRPRRGPRRGLRHGLAAAASRRTVAGPSPTRLRQRVLLTTGADPMTVDGIPAFKNANAMRFPLVRRGATPSDAGDYEGAAYVVVVCDPLFDEVVGAPCGGPAEDAWIATAPRMPSVTLVDRFEAGPRRVLSVYAVTAEAPPP